jgi:hypothetical protein
MRSTFVHRLRALGAGSVVAFSLLLVAPAAHADLLGLPGTGCGSQTLEHPFQQWGDPSAYVLAPGGTFEAGATPWSLTGGAGATTGNEPWSVHGTGTSSLALPAGSSATSPGLCASLLHPTLRFFARSIGGSPLDSLRVNVVFASTLGLSSLPIGIVGLSPNWSPTAPFVYLINDLAVLSTAYRVVAFRFTPVGSASWQIDDVYVDPWSKC